MSTICRAGAHSALYFALDVPAYGYPNPEQWEFLGGLTLKEFDLEWETTDASTDDTPGHLRDQLATALDATVAGTGICRNGGPIDQSLTRLTRIATSKDPVAWVRLSFPDDAFILRAVIRRLSREAVFDDVTQHSLDAVPAAGPGLIITRHRLGADVAVSPALVGA